MESQFIYLYILYSVYCFVFNIHVYCLGVLLLFCVCIILYTYCLVYILYILPLVSHSGVSALHIALCNVLHHWV